MKDLTAAQQQDLLDELAGAIRKQVINGAWPGWLRAVVSNARKGLFQLNHGLAIKAERQRRTDRVAQEVARKSEARRRAAIKPNKELLERARRELFA